MTKFKPDWHNELIIGPEDVRGQWLLEMEVTSRLLTSFGYSLLFLQFIIGLVDRTSITIKVAAGSTGKSIEITGKLFDQEDRIMNELQHLHAKRDEKDKTFLSLLNNLENRMIVFHSRSFSLAIKIDFAHHHSLSGRKWRIDYSLHDNTIPTQKYRII